MHIGHTRGGGPSGLAVECACFILPAAADHGPRSRGPTCTTGGCRRQRRSSTGRSRSSSRWWRGAVNLARVAVKRRLLAVLGAGALIATAAGGNEVLVPLSWACSPRRAGRRRVRRRWRARARNRAPLWPGAPPAAGSAEGESTQGPDRSEPSFAFGGAAAAGAGVAVGAVPFGLAPLFLVFAKIGSILFGSGYVLLAFPRADLVERLGWMTEAQLLDAVTVGQDHAGAGLHDRDVHRVRARRRGGRRSPRSGSSCLVRLRRSERAHRARIRRSARAARSSTA